mmetsp:Transcript_27837/g.67596  ORF Transcript_27837/g.67596 Transcript_27837/m.67596 type:complete len:525 (-) Transcript_27837:257-1831(-)
MCAWVMCVGWEDERKKHVWAGGRAGGRAVVVPLRRRHGGLGAPAVDALRVGAELEQQAHGARGVVGGGDVQRGARVVVGDVDVDVLGAHEAAHLGDVVAGGGAQQALGAVVLVGAGARRRLQLERALRRVVDVEAVHAAQLLEEGHAARAVAHLVEARRPRADAADAGHGGDDAAAHARLGRAADLDHELAALVVHAARGHQREAVAHGGLGQHARAGGRAHAAVGERGGEHRDRLARGRDRAQHEVELHGGGQVGAVGEHALLAHHVREAEVAVGRRELRQVRAVGEAEVAGAAACGAHPRVEHVVEAVADGRRRLHERRRHDGARVDVRIVRQAVGVQHALVEAAARRLAAHVAVHLVLAVLLERERVREHLRARLDAELRARVAVRELLPVDGARRDAELLGVDARQLRYVRRHGAARVAAHVVEHGAQLGGEVLERREHEAPLERALQRHRVRRRRHEVGGAEHAAARLGARVQHRHGVGHERVRGEQALALQLPLELLVRHAHASAAAAAVAVATAPVP